MTLRATVRIPNPRNIPNFNEKIRKSTVETGKELNKLFNRTTTTWQHRVKFRRRMRGFNRVTVSTNDPPYFFVNNGTRVRRALMTPDFVPKSKPRTLRQGVGRGGVQFISRKIQRPGIKAREFDKVIAKKIKPKMRAILLRNLRS